MDAFLGEIRLMSFGFEPRFWAECNGQLLPIAQNQALFALLGTYFGGNGQTTFGLPDLRGRVPLSAGNSYTGNYTQGQNGGEETHTLIANEMPQHLHTVAAYNGSADSGTPATQPGPNTVLAQAYAVPTGGGTTPVNRYSTASATITLAASEIGAAGGSQAHENRQPYLAMNYCICTQGVFPSRD